MNERGLLLVVALAAYEVPRARAWLAEGARDPDEDGPWLAIVNATPRALALTWVDRPLWPRDDRPRPFLVEPGRCARVAAGTGPAREVGVEWYADGHGHARRISMVPATETLVIGGDGELRAGPPLAPGDLAACRAYWKSACTKGYVHVDPAEPGYR